MTWLCLAVGLSLLLLCQPQAAELRRAQRGKMHPNLHICVRSPNPKPATFQVYPAAASSNTNALYAYLTSDAGFQYWAQAALSNGGLPCSPAPLIVLYNDLTGKGVVFACGVRVRT